LPIIKKLNAGFNGIMRDPEAAKQLAAEGAEVTPWTPAQFGALIENNLATWKRVARDADIRAELLVRPYEPQWQRVLGYCLR
jgi:tripartite-type tricarboxylate transporter receptor subunit TctC